MHRNQPIYVWENVINYMYSQKPQAWKQISIVLDNINLYDERVHSGNLRRPVKPLKKEGPKKDAEMHL